MCRWCCCCSHMESIWNLQQRTCWNILALIVTEDEHGPLRTQKNSKSLSTVIQGIMTTQVLSFVQYSFSMRANNFMAISIRKLLLSICFYRASTTLKWLDSGLHVQSTTTSLLLPAQGVVMGNQRLDGPVINQYWLKTDEGQFCATRRSWNDHSNTFACMPLYCKQCSDDLVKCQVSFP